MQLLRGRLTVMRCLRYLERQKSDITTLLDYWNMARRAGLDLRDEHVQLPKSIKREHDRLVEADRTFGSSLADSHGRSFIPVRLSPYRPYERRLRW